jgi:hypothetical protein
MSPRQALRSLGMTESSDYISSSIAERANVLTREIDGIDTAKGTDATLAAHLAAINTLLGMVTDVAAEVDRLSAAIDKLKGHSVPS